MNRRRTMLCVIVATASCEPVFPPDSQLIERPRILAMRSLPAEARPGDAVRWEALVAGPDGTVATAPEWAWCTQPRRVEERTAVSAVCAAGDGLQPTPSEATVPTDACSRFGPTPLPAEDGEPDRRPTDPDPSGGYYQPIRAIVDEETTAFGRTRVRCDLAGATRRIFDAFEDRYTPNVHPRITELRVQALDSEPGIYELMLDVEPGSAEPYVVYRPDSSELVDVVETLRVTWYANGGVFDTASTLVAEDQSRARWTTDAPEPGTRIWAVLRDDRGGSHWTEVEVSP